MTLRILLPTTLFFGLCLSLIPAQSNANTELQKYLLYGGVTLGAIALIKIVQDKPQSGLVLAAIGAGCVAASRPEQTRQLFDTLMGKRRTESFLDDIERNLNGLGDWFSRKFNQ